jgi:hypothetical protein
MQVGGGEGQGERAHGCRETGDWLIVRHLKSPKVSGFVRVSG